MAFYNFVSSMRFDTFLAQFSFPLAPSFRFDSIRAQRDSLQHSYRHLQWQKLIKIDRILQFYQLNAF